MNILDFSSNHLVSWLEAEKIQPYRAKQIFKWVYSRQTDSFNEMTDLKESVRELLSRSFSINRLEMIHANVSEDGSKKYLFRLTDGNHIESVLIPEKKRYTLCLSSQVGCALDCKFCLTGKNGFVRNLTQGEILAQIRDVINDLEPSQHLTNLVFMGMGEPLANYKNVLGALFIIMDMNFGLGFSSRRVTLSTAGMVNKLSVLGQDTTVNLAVSLNAADNETRSMLMPINRQFPIEKLLDACVNYPLKKRRRITIEYILMNGINDSSNDARRLCELLKPIPVKINLIPFNSYPSSEFERSLPSAISDFQNILLDQHFTVMIRHSKGQDIGAACGQLRAHMTSSV